MEANLVPRAGVPFTAVPAAGVHGVGLLTLPKNLWQVARGALAARRVLREFRPEVLFFTGGYVGVPVALAGWSMPKALYVPDVEPALATRLIARSADLIAVTSERSREYYASDRRVVVTGYPTRPELTPMERSQACAVFGLEHDRPIVMVLGGSRGARSINQALWGGLDQVLEQAQVIHITGELDWSRVEEVTESIAPALKPRYRPHAYLHEEMAAAFSAADLVVSRAGASTLGELPLFGLPALLVPYPHAWRYQAVNADYLASRGAAVRLEDSDLGEKLVSTLLSLLGDRKRLQAMSDAARKLAAPAAAEKIARELMQLSQAKDGGHG
jgi:UDP-N-acetylglucosamine--N-acetylmuramyl-(pentapeptide) pyrophosphoryl-undecaprenol N-acetylglucosamine transferase